MYHIVDKKICIIGGTGSLGESLILRYKDTNRIFVISRDEMKQWQLKLKYPDIICHLGDIRNTKSMAKLLKAIQPNIVINCAALKHIDICESNISECIATNITGTQGIIDICSDLQSVEKVLFVSTDKACYPVNVYGMAKSISERMMAEASVNVLNKEFLCVRYGNVLNSRGSLIPKFKELALSDCTYIPVTSDKMTRFFMRIEQSVELIDKAIKYGKSGDTWIPKIPSFKIIDLANYFATKYGKTIKLIGIRPGEKYHECLINQEEIARTTFSHDCYIIKPCYQNYSFNSLNCEYTSENTTNFEELIEMIL